MATSLVHADTPLTFFHGLVEEALEHQRVRPLEETTFYLVTLLAGFVNPERPGAGLTDDPLAVRLASALQSGGTARREGLRRVGDLSLFVSGFFPDSLTRTLVDVDYYIAVGGEDLKPFVVEGALLLKSGADQTGYYGPPQDAETRRIAGAAGVTRRGHNPA